MFDGLFQKAEKVRWDVVSATAADDRVWLERVDRFWFDGREVTIECAGVFELADGRIREVRDYVDMQTWRDRRGTA